MKQIAYSLSCLVALVMISVGLTACSSNPHKAEELETEMESKGKVKDETVGIKDGEMVVQKKALMSEELRKLQFEVYELEDRVYGNRKFGSKGLYGVLKDCRTKVSDRKLGGDGKLKWIEPVERVTDKEDDFKIGLDEQNNLVAVSEEYIKDRITRFRGYKQTLMKRQDEYEEKVDICKAELRARQSEQNAMSNTNDADL